MLRKILLFGILFIFFVALSNCAMPRTISFDEKLFNENLQKWKNKAVKDYVFTYYSVGFSSYTCLIKVMDNKISTYEFDNDYSNDVVKTIDGYFDKIINDYRTNNNKEYTDNETYFTAFNISYNSEYGYPEKIHYEYYCPKNFAVDGNFSYGISSFDLTGDVVK